MVKKILKRLPAIARSLVSGLKKSAKADNAHTPAKHSSATDIIAKGEPVIISRSEHNVSRRDICPFAKKVIYRLRVGGFESYLVGGGVRDLLLGRKPKDFDISTSAHPGQIKKLFRNCWLIGRRFRLAHIRFGDTIIETSTFRKRPLPGENVEDETGKLLVKDDNTFGTPREDAFRRDFTINGLFYDIESFAVIDHVGGVQDIRDRIIRCIGDPEVRFQEDPVRMLRAVRFASRLGFSIEPETYAAILKYAPDINHAANARLFEEVLRLFAYSSGEAAFRMLYETGLFAELIPYVHEYLKTADDKKRENYFLYLQHFDSYLKRTHSAPDPSEALATLVYPLLFEKISDSPKDTQAVQLIRIVAHGLNENLTLPRRMLDHIKRIHTAIQRLDAKTRRRFNKARFMDSDCFDFALVLYGFSVKIEGLNPERLKRWTELYSQHISKGEIQREPEPKEEPAVKTTKKKRRRRPRKKSSEGHREPAAQTNTPAPESDTPPAPQDGNSSAANEADTPVEAPVTPGKSKKRKRSTRGKTSSGSHIISRKRPGKEKPLVDSGETGKSSHHWLDEI